MGDKRNIAQEEETSYAFQSLTDECFGRQDIADLLLDDNAHPQAKKFFAQQVAAQHERNEKLVTDSVKLHVNPNSPFYNPAKHDRYKEAGAILPGENDEE